MIERYLDRFARLLVDYCLEVGKGDEVLIRADIDAKPLVREVVREVAKRGAYPIVILYDEEIQEVFYRTASEEVLSHVSKIERDLVEIPSCILIIEAPRNVRSLASVPPEKITARARARRELLDIMDRREAEGSLRWCLTVYPTPSLAQEAEMSFEAFEEFVIKACMLDVDDPVAKWTELKQRLERLAEKLSRYTEFRIVHPDGTDLRLVVDKSRTWIVDDGKCNMPGGEIFTAPVEETVEGVIYFPGPQTYYGVTVRDVKLVFRNGEVVEATARENEDFLKKIITTDEGSKRVGELGIGLNYGITQLTKNILFDEKIGGTIHLALGAAYRRCGGKNVSGVHWDLVKDMRRGGKIYADGELIYENGKFLIDE